MQTEINTPEWVKNSIFYQIFPDRFARSLRNQQKFLKSASLEAWEAPPTLHGYKGGNLWGVIERLDYLQNLGINAIYLNPIFLSASNHRYHPLDYYQVDPLLGGNEAFSELLDAAHQRDIKIVLDGVFNHASRGFYFFNDILENGPHSPWIDWFKINDWPLCPYPRNEEDRKKHPSNYAGWHNHRALPQFNHDNRDVREYLLQVAEYWTKKGIDGWRLDAPECIQTPGFWQRFRERVKSINPDVYIVGEILSNGSQWLDGTQFDGITNYEFRNHALPFVVGDRIVPQHIRKWDSEPTTPLNAVAYADKIEQLLKTYPPEIQFTQLNFLSCHDTARLITLAGEDHTSVELGTLLLLTFQGAPCIYYGDEIGMAGSLDPDCRRGFPTIEAEWDQDILAYHRKLIDLRRTYTALRIGDYKPLLAKGDIYVFARIWQDQEVIIAVNVSNQPVEERVKLKNTDPETGYIYELKTQSNEIFYGSGEASWISEGELSYLILTLPPRSGMVLGSKIG